MSRREQPGASWRAGYRAALDDLGDEPLLNPAELEEEDDDTDEEEVEEEIAEDVGAATIQRRINRAIDDAYELGREHEADEDE